MKKITTKNSILKYIAGVIAIPLICFTLQASADEFSPLDLAYTYSTTVTNPTIKLDTKKISPAEIDFPSPSEFQTRTYKNKGGAFEPPEDDIIEVIEVIDAPEKTYTFSPTTVPPKNPESEVKSIPKEEPVFTQNELPYNNITEKGFTPISRTNPSLENAQSMDKAPSMNFLPFDKYDEMVQPSQYKDSLLPKRRVSPVPAELIPDFPYYTSVQQEEIVQEDSYEGKTISEINIKGLYKIKPGLIMNTIQTKQGSSFDSELLQQDLQRIYALGYFSDNMAVEPELLSDGTIELNFSVIENAIVKNIKITGNTVFTTPELMVYVKKLKNMPQNIANINECISNINKHYEEQGYILAHVKSIDDTPDGTLILNISEGVIEKFEFNEDKRTKDYVIKRNMLTQPGTVYNEELIKKDITRIYATQIFDDVERIIEQSPDKEGQYIVKIKVKEASSDSLSIGGGVDSGIGIFGSIGINNKNFLGRGQTFGVSGMIGSGILLSDASIKHRMNYNLEINFREPYFLNADTALDAKMYYRDLGSYKVPLAIERRFGFGGTVTHKMKNFDNVKTSLGLGFEHISLSEGDGNRISTLYDLSHINITERAKQLTGGSFFNISPGVTYAKVDDEFMPRNGLVASASFTEALGMSYAKNTNGRLSGKITKYIPVFKKSTLSITGKGGLKVHGDEMPEVMAFGLGGPYTIRGFRMNGVGTGNSYLMGSVELQTPIPLFDRFKYDVLKNMRFAVFADAGKVFNPTISAKLYDRPLKAISAGVGLRINIPHIGPIAIDYAIPFTHVGKYNHRGGYFTFGTSGWYDY